jgi:hypothetical protein
MIWGIFNINEDLGFDFTLEKTCILNVLQKMDNEWCNVSTNVTKNWRYIISRIYLHSLLAIINIKSSEVCECVCYSAKLCSAFAQRLHYNHGLLVVSSKADHCNLFCPVNRTVNMFQISPKFKSCDLGYLLVQNLLSFPPGWEKQLGKLVVIEEHTSLLRVPVVSQSLCLFLATLQRIQFVAALQTSHQKPRLNTI